MSSDSIVPSEGSRASCAASCRMSPSSTNGAMRTHCASPTPLCSLRSAAMPVNCWNLQGLENRPVARLQSLAVRAGDEGYASRAAKLTEQCAQAREPAELTNLVQQAGLILGADHAFFTDFEHDGVVLRHCRYMVERDAAWSLEYFDGALAEHDPWLSYAMFNSRPVLAHEVLPSDPHEEAVVNLFRKGGFASAVLVPVPTIDRFHGGLLCLGSEMVDYFDDEHLPRMVRAARMLALEVHEWWRSRTRDAMLRLVHLNAVDLELLRHEQMGHSTKKIANVLSMSEAAINSRFQRMIAQLGVRSRRGAVAWATEYGLLPAKTLGRPTRTRPRSR